MWSMSPRDARASPPTLDAERAWTDQGFHLIAGLDEVGRGAWAGPVVAAAVILPAQDVNLLARLAHIRDSKQMTPAARVAALDHILAAAVTVGVGVVDVADIDARGILAATRLAMQAAIEHLTPAPDALLIDAVSLPLAIPQRAFPRADQTSLSVAAASVVAKVTRDRLMTDYDTVFPGYTFSRHKGYGTPAHAAALIDRGPCPLHRHSFAPVRAVQLRLLDPLSNGGGEDGEE